MVDLVRLVDVVPGEPAHELAPRLGQGPILRAAESQVAVVDQEPRRDGQLAEAVADPGDGAVTGRVVHDDHLELHATLRAQGGQRIVDVPLLVVREQRDGDRGVGHDRSALRQRRHGARGPSLPRAPMRAATASAGMPHPCTATATSRTARACVPYNRASKYGRQWCPGPNRSRRPGTTRRPIPTRVSSVSLGTVGVHAIGAEEQDVARLEGGGEGRPGVVQEQRDGVADPDGADRRPAHHDATRMREVGVTVRAHRGEVPVEVPARAQLGVRLEHRRRNHRPRRDPGRHEVPSAQLRPGARDKSLRHRHRDGAQAPVDLGEECGRLVGREHLVQVLESVAAQPTRPRGVPRGHPPRRDSTR